MAILKNSLVGYNCVGRTCASSGGQKTARLGACSAGDGALKVAIGYLSSTYNSGAENTAFGARSLSFNTGACNTGFGGLTIRNGSGNCNTAVGHSALNSLSSGGGNTAVGYGSLGNLSTGNKNVGVGAYAGLYSTTGSRNTFVGYKSKVGCYSSGLVTVLGACAKACGSYGTAIGCTAYAIGAGLAIGNGVVAGNNVIKWGSSTNSWCNCVWGTWSYISDCRDKADILELDDNLGINLIRKLKPVNYKNDNRQSYVKTCNYEYGVKDGNLKVDRRSYGFIAQDVEDAANELNIQFEAVKYDETMDAFRLSYSQLLASIVKTIKTVDERIQILKTKI